MRARSETGLGTPAQQKIKFKKNSALTTPMDFSQAIRELGKALHQAVQA